MKTVMAFICSLVLLVAPTLMAQPSPCPASQTVATCHCCGCCCHPGQVMSCCMASSSAHSQSAPANSSRTTAQNDFSLLALALLTSAAPVAEARPQISPTPSPLTVTSAPLLDRLCVRLI